MKSEQAVTTHPPGCAAYALQKVSDHVGPGNNLTEQEERDLQLLSAQGQQAARQDLRRCSLFFSFVMELGMPFVFVDRVFMPDDLGTRQPT